MNKKKHSRLPDFNLNYKIWLSTLEGEGILGDGKWRILKLIEEKGSLMAACEELGYTYRRTWGNLKRIEKILGFPLLEKQRGGKDGGRTFLSPEGKKLVEAFDTFHSRVDMTIQEGFLKLMDDLKDI